MEITFLSWGNTLPSYAEMEVVIHAKIEIPSLHILTKAQAEEIKWIKEHNELLSLIDEKEVECLSWTMLSSKDGSLVMTRKTNLAYLK